MSINIDFTKEPKEVVSYLKQKDLALTFNYEEMMHDAHHRAFTVAKVTNLDLLGDIHESLQNAFKAGKPFKEWKAEITPTLKQYGWHGTTTVTDPKTGLQKEIYVGSRRLKTIFDTNMRVAYAQARYKSQMLSDAEYFRYTAVLDGKTRPAHRSLHGTILLKSDPFWQTNYPPNSWHCRCKVQAVTKFEVANNSWSVSQNAPASIADKDWAYNPGNTDITKIYKSKTDAISSDKLKAIASKEYAKDIAKLKQNNTLFKEIQTLFEAKDKKVELCKSDIFGKEKSVLLSSQTVQSHLHHEDINAFDYSLIPDMLLGEKRVFRQNDTKYIVVKKLERGYRLTIKDVADTDEIYAVSLVNLGSNIDSELKKLSKFEEVQD